MKKISDYFQYFAYITFGIVIVCAVNFSLFHNGELPQNTLWEILFSSFLTTAVTVVLIPTDCEKNPRVIWRLVFHYLCLCVIMTGCGLCFGWMDFTLKGALMMFMSVACVYFIAFLLHYTADQKLANQLNEALKKRNGG